MILATQKDIDGDLKASLYLYKSEYDILDIESSLNFLTQLVKVVLEPQVVMGRHNFTWDEINGELTTFLDPFFFDYSIAKFANRSNEFKFWKFFFFEAMTGGTEYNGEEYRYTKEKLFNIISEKPDELIPYFPFNAFVVEGTLSPSENEVVLKKIKKLINFVNSEKQTTRIKIVSGYLDFQEPLIP